MAAWARLPRNISFRCPFRIHVLVFKSWPLNHFAKAKAFGSGTPGVMGTCCSDLPCWTRGCPDCSAASFCWAICCWRWCCSTACCFSWVMYWSKLSPAFLASASICWRCQSWNCCGVMPRFRASSENCCCMAAICWGDGWFGGCGDTMMAMFL